MVNSKSDWFVKSDYWRNWSRSFVRMGGQYDRAVEVTVSPLNGWDFEYADMKALSVRVHLTSEPVKQFTHHVPDYIYDRCSDRLGKEFADFLFNADLYPEFGTLEARMRMGLFERHITRGGGGVPMAILCPHNEQLKTYWAEGISPAFKHAKDLLGTYLNLDIDAVNNLDIYDRLNEREYQAVRKRGQMPCRPTHWMGGLS